MKNLAKTGKSTEREREREGPRKKYLSGLTNGMKIRASEVIGKH